MLTRKEITASNEKNAAGKGEITASKEKIAANKEKPAWRRSQLERSGKVEIRRRLQQAR